MTTIGVLTGMVNLHTQRFLSARQRRSVKARDEKCRYCMDAPAETVDHVIPYILGGSTNSLNSVGACFDCNNAKGSRTPKEAGMKLHLPLRFFDYAQEMENWK